MPDISKGRKKRGGKKAKIVMANYDNPSSPAQAAAVGYLNADCPGEPDGVSHAPVGKADAAEMAAPASAYGNPRNCDDFSYGRLSEGLRPGAAGGGDHGVATGRNAAVAFGHRDLRQSDVDFSDVLARLRTVRGNTIDLGVPDGTPGGFSHAGEVALRSFDAASQAGTYGGMQPVDHNPSRPDYHQAGQSPTRPNGSHDYGSQAGAVSNAVAGKMSNLDIMKRALFGG